MGMDGHCAVTHGFCGSVGRILDRSLTSPCLQTGYLAQSEGRALSDRMSCSHAAFVLRESGSVDSRLNGVPYRLSGWTLRLSVRNDWEIEYQPHCVVGS